jgi:hypothetical protein
VLALLAEGQRSLDDLVRIPAVPRRTVEELLTAAGPDVITDGGNHQLAPSVRDRYVEAFDLDHLAGTSTPDGTLDLLREFVTSGPPPLSALDHVTATPETALRRAEWLRDHYDLHNAHLLCLGDHDLTSLAVALLTPSTTVTVVDVDERVLRHIDAMAAARDLRVRTLHADLRFGLPPVAATSADLVFTDPPYTPEGIGLFTTRAAECLADSQSRVLIAYGFSERSPALGLKVQQELLRLGMAFEAILPDFHRYQGAQAIGSASDLYVCQPTAHTRKLALRQNTGIYTHGPHSVESSGSGVSETFLHQLGEVTGATVATLRDPGWNRPITGSAVFDLRSDPGPWLLRMLLATNAEQSAFLVSNNHPDITDERAQRALRDLLVDKVSLRFHRSSPDSQHALVVAKRAEPTSVARSQLLNRVHGKLGNTWREALISAAAASDTTMTKRAAKDLVAAAAPVPDDLDLRLIDLPRHRLAPLLRVVGEEPLR